MTDRPALPGWLLALVALALMTAWVLAINVVAGVAAALLAASRTTYAVALLQNPGVMGVAAGLQMAGMAGIAMAVAALARRGRFGAALGLRRAGIVALAAAIVVGGTVGFWSGWVAQVVLEHIPLPGNDIFETLERALLDGPLLPRLVLYAVVVVGAPICEELVFRGVLWDSIEESAGPLVAWLLTSALFASYHLVPIHVLSVFTTGALIGLLRWGSGSIWPAMAAHFVNNALAVGLVLALGPADEAIVSLPLALGSLVLAGGAAAGVLAHGALRRRAARGVAPEGLVRSPPAAEPPTPP